MLGTWKSYVPPGDPAISIRACFCTGTWTIWSSYCICGTSTWRSGGNLWKSGGFRDGINHITRYEFFWSQLAKKFSRWCHHWWMGLNSGAWKTATTTSWLRIPSILQLRMCSSPYFCRKLIDFEVWPGFDTSKSHRFWGLTWVWYLKKS